MARTFHSFLLLPWELRNQIWEYALRPDRPGAHIFKVSHESVTDGSQSESERSWKLLRPGYVAVNEPRLPLELYLSAPDTRPTDTVTRHSEIDSLGSQIANPSSIWFNNPSTYLADGGLWTACKESRLVMERRFQTQKWDAVREARREKLREKLREDLKQRVFSLKWTEDPTWEWKAEEWSMPATGYFRSDERSATDGRFFTVLPHCDLLIFQPQDPEILDTDTWWCWLRWYVPFGNKDLGFKPLGLIALEYDPAWDDAVNAVAFSEPAIFQTLIEAALDSYLQIGTLWFVDRRIKIAKETESLIAEGELHVFYDEKGRYVDVTQEALFFKEQDGADLNCGWFLREIECGLHDRFGEWDSGVNERVALGILAYEPQ
ncbi:hypothetical protein CONLIGDRAFT_644409 [Coniochaeta ligniaria NRRL 30616]|uniref:2EXR domain-containing protein n=1 Tax=Coniochaeta ligniaria NRRL 30616 TaxID=1408157 RepID=A0A1J7ILE9_9PEZI|nr:hypothetical protein CONLIGDRAFT_644409 [Coniochaeta ligniaria NRRL 30616]